MNAGFRRCIKCGKPIYGLFDDVTCDDCKAIVPRYVIDDIRAEIEHEKNRDIGSNSNYFVSGYKCGLGECLEIIDKHTKGVKE